MQFLNEENKLILCAVHPIIRKQIISSDYCPLYYKLNNNTFSELVHNHNIYTTLLINSKLTLKKITINMIYNACYCHTITTQCTPCNLLYDLTGLRSYNKFFNITKYSTIKKLIDNIKETTSEECIVNC